MVMTIFYRLLKRKTSLSVAEVMREAQLEVLGLDCEKAGALLDDIMGDWSGPDTLGRVPAEFVSDAEFLLLTLKMILEQLDWSSPFYWAPFTLMGYGDFRFLGAEDGEDDVLLCADCLSEWVEQFGRDCLG